jgi:glycosyltransferase involved in cell wall biosynthesis
VAGLAHAIADALDRPDEARRRGAAARERAARSFSLEAMIDAWERAIVDSPGGLV